MTKTFTILFFLKTRTGQTKDRPRDIYVRVTTDGMTRDLSLQRKCLPELWDQTTGRAVSRIGNMKTLNSFLDTVEAKVHEARHRLMQLGKPITAQHIGAILRDQEPEFEKKHFLLEVFRLQNERAAALQDKEYAKATLVRFNTALKHTRDFIRWKYKVEDIDIKRLDYEFVSDFEFWFKTVKGCDHNTTIKYIACCRKIILRCMKHGWLLRDPFLGFSMALREVEREALTKEELERITARHFVTDRLNQVRDIFLFSCYTGLAYADVRKLRRSELVTGIDGGRWIFTHRQKTATSSHIPLLPPALDIVNRYEQHPGCQAKGSVLPVMSNQKMNAYLKEIADLCGIQKNLTFHIARHTFATTITLSNGVPIESVSKMLGHTNIKTTQHYAKTLDVKVSQDMQALKEKLTKQLPYSNTATH